MDHLERFITELRMLLPEVMRLPKHEELVRRAIDGEWERRSRSRQ